MFRISHGLGKRVISLRQGSPTSSVLKSFVESQCASPHLTPQARSMATETSDYRAQPAAHPLDFPFTDQIRSVLLVKKWQSKSAAEYSRNVASWLTKRGVQVFVEPTTVGDYNTDYPTILDLVHHSDLDSPKYIAACFPSLAAANYSRAPSLAHALSAAEQPIDETNLTPLKRAEFWSTFQRDPKIANLLGKLDPRECISYARRHSAWQQSIDAVISIGGDGTLLHVSSLFPRKVPPTLPFGCGSFGFLMPFNPDFYERTLTRLMSGQLRIYNRARLAFKVGGVTGYDSKDAPIIPPFADDDPQCFHLLNEVVLKHSYGLNVGVGISEIECRVDGHVLARYQGDGVLVASPTGSTAYSMAVGGSIVHPAMQCLLLSPISPMTLSSRPLVLPMQSTVTLCPLRDSVLLEGKYGRVVQPGEVVTVRHSAFPLPVFARDDATTDFVTDLGNRLNYARMVRFKRVEDDTHLNAEGVPEGPMGSFISKSRDSRDP